MPTLEAADLVIPQALDEGAQRKAMPGAVMYAFARLKPGVSIALAEAELQPVFNYSLSLTPPAFRKDVHLRVRSLRDRQIHDVRLVAWILFSAVLAVLLIACANVMSLLMARAAARERELAMRSALGAAAAGWRAKCSRRRSCCRWQGLLPGVFWQKCCCESLSLSLQAASHFWITLSLTFASSCSRFCSRCCAALSLEFRRLCTSHA